VDALTDAEVTALGGAGWFSRENFLGAELARRVRAQAAAVPLRRAGVRRAGELDDAIRSDELAWVTPELFPEAVAAFDALMTQLNERAWLGLRRFDLQLARYPPGAKYVRHRDAFPGDDNRRVTAIVYLNPAWAEGDGGKLRLFVEPVIDLAPRLDRLVVFRSELIEHEVLPAHAERWALTAWYSAR
jgi:SM-20-related protein